MIISVDTGNKQIKSIGVRSMEQRLMTNGRTFTAGLVDSRTSPPFGGDVLQYRDTYYSLSEKRIPYMWDKTKDDRYFILTLFAIAYELIDAGVYNPDDISEIKLLIGLPPKHYGALREKYHQYFLGGRNELDFVFNGRPFCIRIAEVCVYPQAYAAIASEIEKYGHMSKVMIIDVGGYTADYLQLIKGRVDLSLCDSLDYGTIKFYNTVKSDINSQYGRKIDETDIDSVLKAEETLLDDAIASRITQMGINYVRDLFNTMRELEIDLVTSHTVFVGGGSALFRPLIENCPEMLGKWSFIDNIAANAVGYVDLYEYSR
jgi:plasmid segregation protein ParM